MHESHNFKLAGFSPNDDLTSLVRVCYSLSEIIIAYF